MFADEATIRDLKPDFALLSLLPGRLQSATAPGDSVDCASRSFGPRVGITEDPVCGSAHCQIAPYWSTVLKKNVIEAEQASRRSGFLRCEIRDERLAVPAAAALVAVGDIVAFDQQTAEVKEDSVQARKNSTDISCACR